MHPKKTRFKTLSLTLLWLFSGGLLAAQPFSWDATDFAGNRKFSVLADSIYGLLPEVFAAQTGNEQILFSPDPFHPLKRVSGAVFFPLNERFFGCKTAEGVRLSPARNPGFFLPGFFRKVEIWQGEILAFSDVRCLFRPGESDEIQADSCRKESQRLFLFRGDGLVVVDSGRKSGFIPVRGQNRRLNPSGSYLLSDSLWIPVKNPGNSFRWFPQGIWWNDTSYLDSSRAEGVFIQTPSRTRYRLGDSMAMVSNRYLLLKKKSGSFFYSGSGKPFPIPAPQEIRCFHDTLCGWKSRGRWYFIGKSGNRYPVNKTITELGNPEEGMIRAKAGKRYGFVDPMGFIRISCRYDSILPFREGFTAARLGSVWGYLDRDERIRIQPHFSVAMPFSNGLAAVKKEGKWGLVNTSADYVQACQFDTLFQGKYFGWSTTRSKWKGWLNNEGRILLPNRYTDIIEPCFGLIQVFRDGRTGLFSTLGHTIFPIQYHCILAEPKIQMLFAR